MCACLLGEGEKEGGDQGTSRSVHSLQLEETRGELVRSTEERKGEVQQYKAEASSARLEHEEAKKSFDSQVRSSGSTDIWPCYLVKVFVVEWKCKNEASVHRTAKEFAVDRKSVHKWCQYYSILKGQTHARSAWKMPPSMLLPSNVSQT